ncbi:hypothetical protein PGT21_011406 [Puccinia graminis f. sp. tritici]|uniref:Uncharacterized protein n=1 Tax=Puccinia graminis f. sp. tritici TaxID=56615 RepID=A0A5B0NBS6_PUCGR|nr:hypothetical protein PGT21_011406 [Puccinia graminis f. sp. tritici]KAA1135980.1 hypothetical protein PGTUg99_015316 [Puccinia graminis f. sp. tritici]
MRVLIVLLMTITAGSVLAELKPSEALKCGNCAQSKVMMELFSNENNLYPSSPYTGWRHCRLINNSNTNCGGLVQGKEYQCQRCKFSAFFPLDICKNCKTFHSVWYYKDTQTW